LEGLEGNKMKKQREQEVNKIFSEMPDEMKLDFLRKALEKNETLRSQFTLYYNELTRKPTHTLPFQPDQMIADTCAKLQNELELLDFNNMDWRKYVPRHSGYIEDYEAWEYFAEDHLNAIFEGWKTEILGDINHGLVAQAVCKCLGMHDACLNAEIPGSENIFDDLTETLLQDHQEIMIEAIDALEHTVKSGNLAMTGIEIILNHYQEKFPGIKNYLRYYESMLISLTETGETAAKVLSLFESKSIEGSVVPKLALKVASFDKDPLIWRETAEEYMELDLDVAKQLLDHYWTEDPVCFRLVGRKQFKEHPAELCDYFSELLFPLFDEGFYKEVFRYKSLRDRDLDLYKVLRDYLTEEEKFQFAGEILFDHVFKVGVLALEERYADILTLAQKEALHSYFFTEMITPILTIYPAEVMELIRIKCADILRYHKKRSAYKHVAEWLKLALQIKGMEDKARHLIHELYNRKPALPALKEEMRKAGVVNDK